MLATALRGLLPALLILGILRPGAADADAPPGRDAPAVVVGVENIEYFPYYANRNGEYVGFARDLLDAFARARGLRLVYRPLPVARLLVQFLAGEVDLKFPDNPDWAPKAKAGKAIRYSDPVVAYIDGVSVRPDRLGRGAAAIRKLGQVLGFTPVGWQARIDDGAVEAVNNPNLEALLTLTIDGRVDGAYGNIAVVQHVLTNIMMQPGSLVFDPALPHVASHYALSSIRRPDLVAEFDAWIARDRTTVHTLLQQYGLRRESGGPHP